MTEYSRSVQMFIDAINSDAISKCDEIENELKKYTEDELKGAQAEADKKAEEYKAYESQRILSKVNRSKSAALAAVKKEIAEKRDSIKSEVFAAVKSEIEKFTSGEEYEAFLIKSAEKLTAEFKDKEYRLYLRKEDEKFKNSLNKYGEIEIDTAIVLGGVKLVCGNITADDTLDRRLQEQEEYFKQISEMEI